MAIPDLRSALVVLQTYLETKLAEEPHLSTFAPYGGVDVVLLDEEPTEVERVGKPHILLSGVSGTDERWGRGYERATIASPAIASDFAGAKDDTPSQSLLSQALVSIVRDGRPELIGLGLEGASIAEGRQSYSPETSDAPGVATKDHTITVFYSTE